MIKAAVIVLILLGLLGAVSPKSDATGQRPAPTTLINPTTSPTGGEPGIPAGPPNPGFDLHCGYASKDDSLKGVVHVEGGTPNPECKAQR